MRLLSYVMCVFLSWSGSISADDKTDGLYSTARLECVDSNGVRRSLSAGLKRLEDGAWRLTLAQQQMRDTSSSDFIEVKIPACEAQKGEDGYFITTTSAIGTFRLDNGRFESSRNYYTFFGMKTPRATWVAIVKGLKQEFDFVAEAKGGKYEVFPRVQLKRMGFEPYEDFVVDFYPLPQKATYADMAKKYRAYQLGRGEVVPLKERIKENPKLERMTKSVLCRAAHGSKPIPQDKNGKRIATDYTLETELPMRLHATCAQVTESIRLLKSMGCDDIDFHEVGWNIRGHDGRYPQLFPVEPAIGGEAALRQTIKTAKELGYNISPHVNHTDAYRIADCWSEDFIAKNKDGTLMNVGCWAGGKAYTPCPMAIFDLFVKNDYEKLKGLGFNGLHHVDVISAIPPRECHDPRHPLNRQQWGEAYLKIMKYAHDIFGGFTSECGFDHVAKHLDFAFYINHKSRVAPMLDRYIPVWQIVYHGIIVTGPPIFEDTGWGLKKSPDYEIGRLRQAEFGGKPVFYGGWTDPLKIENLKKVKAVYDEYQPMSYLQLEFMEDHRELSKDIYLTVYGDGSEVVTNYTEKTFEYRGKKIAAKDFGLYGPGSCNRAKN